MLPILLNKYQVLNVDLDLFLQKQFYSSAVINVTILSAFSKQTFHFHFYTFEAKVKP